MNKTIFHAGSTKRLIWLAQRPNHTEHAAACKEIQRRIDNGAKAAPALTAALDKLTTPVVRATNRVVQSPSAPKGSAKTVAPKEAPKVEVKKEAAPKKVRTLTSFQTTVMADPDTFGEGFGPKRRARGLAPLTEAQREARKALYAEQNG